MFHRPDFQHWGFIRAESIIMSPLTPPLRGGQWESLGTLCNSWAQTFSDEEWEGRETPSRKREISVASGWKKVHN